MMQLKRILVDQVAVVKYNHQDQKDSNLQTNISIQLYLFNL